MCAYHLDTSKVLNLKKSRPYQYAVFSSLSMWENVISLQIAHGKFLILCQMVLLSDINFLIIKQNKVPKIDPKMLKQ